MASFDLVLFRKAFEEAHPDLDKEVIEGAFGGLKELVDNGDVADNDQALEIIENLFRVDTGDDLSPPEDFDEEEPVEEKIAPANATQEILISYMIGSYDTWVLVAPILKPIYFEKQYAPVIEFLFQHSEKYGEVPSPPKIKIATGLTFEIPKDAGTDASKQWCVDELEAFCRHQAMRQEVLKAAELIGTDSSRSAAEKVCASMQNVLSISVTRDLGIEIHRDSKRVLTEKEDTIQVPTRYRHMDLLMGGGMPRPGVMIVAGKSGFGKSVMLSNFAVNYAEAGANVIYISLELSEKRLQRRFASMMTDIHIKEVRSRVEEVDAAMHERLKCGDGYIWVKKLPMVGTTRTDLKAYFNEIWNKEGKKPDVLCLDYLDLLYPATAGIRLDNIHLKDKYTSEELYDFCDKTNMMCFTASQFVKGSDDKESHGQDTVAGGSPKISTCDYLGLLKRDFDQNMVWLTFAKARDGGHEGRVPMKWDNDTLRVTDAEDEYFYEANPRFNPAFHNRGRKERAANRYGQAPDFPVSKSTDRSAEAVMSQIHNRFGVSSDKMLNGELE